MEEERVEKLKSFLSLVWSYVSLDAKVYTIATMTKEGKMRYKHYVMPMVRDVRDGKSVVRVLDYDDMYDKVIQDVIPVREEHVFFQVLPLSRLPDRGRGTSNDVKVAKFLFIDLDYKKEVKEKEFEGCREGEDHALQCFYEDNGRIYKVSRPPLSDLLKVVKIEPTAVVDSGTGYQLYFKMNTEIEVSKFLNLESRLVEFLKYQGLPVDSGVKDPARLMRLPETVNIRVGRLAKVIYQSDKEYSFEELDKVLVFEKPKESAGQFKLLTDAQLIQLKELVKDAYKPGNRQYLAMFLSGWMAEAKIHPIQTMKLIRMLHDETKDEDALQKRLGAVVYSYKKAGLDVDSLAEEIEKEFMIRPDGLEKEIDEGKVKGASGVLEILQKYYGNEKALDVIRQMQDILGVFSPYKDAVVVSMNYEKQIYVVADLKSLITGTARLTKEGLKMIKPVFVGVPIKLEVYINALGGVTKYKVVWVRPNWPRPIEIGPAPFHDVLAKLGAEGGIIVDKRQSEDVLNYIINGFIDRGKAEIKSELEAPGFYLLEGKITTNRVEIQEPSKEELREALALLNELAESWYSHVQAKFATAVKWGIVSPFSFIYKQRGLWMKWLYLYGTSGSGKTTMGEIILAVWGLGVQNEKPGSSIDTPARFGAVISQSTFPVLINEPGNVFNKVDLVEMIKNATQKLTARSTRAFSTYTDEPALAPLVFTSNKPMPLDDALLSRFIRLSFSLGEKMKIEGKREEFEREVKPKLKSLSAIGKFVAYYVVQNQQLKDDWMSFAEELLEEAYKFAELQVPSWIRARHEEKEEENVKQEILDYVYEQAVHAYTMTYGKLPLQQPFQDDAQVKRDILEQVLRQRLVPGIYLKTKNNTKFVVFTKRFADDLANHFPQIANLRSLAELFGWEYNGDVRIGDDVITGVLVPLDKLAEMLAGREE